MSSPDLLTQSPWVWPLSYWREAESAWMCAHKFAFLNALHGDSLKRVLANRPTGPQGRVSMRGFGKLFCAIAYERSKGLRPHAGSDVLRALTMRELFHEHAERAASSALRYCPECLQHWFHANVFQLDGLEICPVHGIPLRTGCPNCGAWIDTEFVGVDFKKPLHCVRCGTPFAGRLPEFFELFGSSSWEYYEPARSLVTLQRALSRACRCVHFVGDWSSDLPLSRPTYLGGLLAGRRLATLVGSFAITTRPAVVALQCSQVRSQLEEEVVAGFRTTVKSIGRHFKKAIRQSCGHKAPPTLDIEIQQPSFDYEAPSWLRPMAQYGFDGSGVCACCFLLARWRVLFAEVFASAQQRRRLYSAEYLHGEAPTLNLAPQTAYAQFSRCAVQIAHGLGLDVTTLSSQDWIGRTDEPAVYRQVWPIAFNHTRVHRNLKFAIGYSRRDVDDILVRLARVSMLPVSKYTAVPRASTYHAIWGQALVALKTHG